MQLSRTLIKVPAIVTHDFRGGISDSVRRIVTFFLLVFLYAVSGLASAQTSTSPTVITIGTGVQQSGVKHLGMNLGGQTYYDSSQMMNNLIFRNPGFEGEMWQSIIHCASVTSTSCVDDRGSVWTANFFQGASVEFIGGSIVGTTGTVASNTAGNQGTGVGLTFSSALNPSIGDYLVVRMSVPGNGQAGWSTGVSGNGSVTTNFTDLSPNSPGKQSLSLSAPGTSSTAGVTAYFDSTPGISFVQLNGTYTLSFRAKLVSGTAPLFVGVTRLGVGNYLSVQPSLTNTWQDLSYTFRASESNAVGTAQVAFGVQNGSILLDDVSLSRAPEATNPTVFRDEVVDTLRTLNPGVLRYMDGGTDWGSSLDNMLTPPFARLRAGYSDYHLEMDDVPMGLHEFMVLCKAIGAEPWYTMPASMSVAEMQNMMDYLGGSTSTVYGARRAALGQAAPWTSVFPSIHLEFGNEVWNTANPGDTYTIPEDYAARASVIFAAAKSSPSYSPVVDLVIDGFEGAPVWTAPVLAAATGYDTVSQAAYFYGPFTDASSNEAIFGSMFSIPEQTNSSAGGLMTTRVNEANTAAVPAKTAVYETNIGAITGTVDQPSLDKTIPSLGAGLTHALNLLTLVRDQGVLTINTFTLAQYGFGFQNSATGQNENTAVYGTLIDMGGPTNRRRPNFLAQQLANQAIRPIMLTAAQSGNNPTWNQVALNGASAINGAHYIQSFAFTDGTTNTLVLFNLSRTTALPVTFAGSNAPTGTVAVSTLTSSAITDNNETSDTVDIVTSSISGLQPSAGITLPPYSMTVLTSGAPTIASLAISCTPTALQIGAAAVCSSSITGNGTFSANVNWSATAGSISASGRYTAPSTVPSGGQVTITATSAQDPTKSASQVVPVTLPVTGVSITCASASMQLSTTDACQATVLGTGTFNSAVVWSATGGTVDQNGLVTSPASAATIVVTATSVQDSTMMGTYTISASATPILTKLVVSNVTSTSVTLTWTTNIPIQAGIDYGPTYGLSMFNPNSAYTMSPSFTVTGLTPGTTYNLLAFGYSTSRVFGALASSFSTASGNGVSSVAVACGSTSLLVGGSTNCSSTVAASAGLSTAVTWTASAGTISSTGQYTAPTSLTGTQNVTITATSVQDPTKSGTQILSVALASGVTGVTVSCTSASVQVLTSDSCQATVAGTGTFSSAIVWSATGASISQNGVVISPGVAATIVVTATSTQDSTKSGSFTISVAAPTINAVVISCTPTSLLAGMTSACTSTVTGTTNFNNAVTWSTSLGSISTSGLYSAPASVLVNQSVSVTATSVQDPTRSATLFLLVGPAPTISAINVSCATSTVQSSTTDACSATVTGLGSYSSSVVWSVSAGSVTQAGLVTAPATSATLVVTATSTQDSTKSGSFTLSAVAPAITSITVVCSPASINAGATVLCGSNVLGTGNFTKAVTWSASTGSISSTGLYTAPTSLTATQNVTVTITSVQDPTKTASQIVTVIPTLSVTGVTLSCAASTLQLLATDACKATVAGTGAFSSAVVWSTSAGSVTQAGLVTAPSSAATLVVRATSTQDSTKFGTFTVAVVGPTISSVAVACTLTSLSAGASSSCSSTVTGTGSYNTAVTWTASAGSISAGQYTAPSSLTTSQNVVITATSVQDTTKSGTLVLTVAPAASSAGISVTCDSPLVSVKQSNSCRALIAGTSTVTSAVVWSATGGTISQAGLVSSAASPTTIVVKATSTADSTKAGTFTIAVVNPALSGLSVTAITSTSATISWVSNVPVQPGIQYGPSTLTTSIYNSSAPYSTTSSITLTGLTPNTYYKILPFGFSVSRVFTSVVSAFTTTK